MVDSFIANARVEECVPLPPSTFLPILSPLTIGLTPSPSPSLLTFTDHFLLAMFQPSCDRPNTPGLDAPEHSARLYQSRSLTPVERERRVRVASTRALLL